MPKFVTTKWREFDVEHLAAQLNELRTQMAQLETRFSRQHQFNGSSGESARNLLHYLALREHDLRYLQNKLSALGLSSLGRCEPHVMATMERVTAVLDQITCRSDANGPLSNISSNQWKNILEQRTAELLGPKVAGRNVRIMVTMPSEAAWNYELVRELVEHGMDCMRINCVYDNPDLWTRMISHLKRARLELGRPCSILMDIPGPKVRTGPIREGTRVVKVRPHRNDLGQVTAPAHIWLTACENSVPAPAGTDAVLQVPAKWLALACAGGRIKFEDARGSKRTFTITSIDDGGCRCEATQTAYLTPETELRLRRRDSTGALETTAIATPQNIPGKEQYLHLCKGDKLLLKKLDAPGCPAVVDETGQVISPAFVSVTPAEVFNDVRAGEAVWFDDGRIGGTIRCIEPSQMTVEITHAGDDGEKLGANKGINFPDTELRLPALTGRDEGILEFIVKNADMIGYSFASDAAGLIELQQRLAALGAGHLGIILKIETRRSFEHLPELLLAALERSKAGVMIARGDLAVECGFERLAEVQEEILWLCEAAHLPVIWATQVLDNLAKEGLPSRAEITDAAMASRAECVMLNKGPHIIRALDTLDNILRRMESHQTKKRAMLRSLRVAEIYATKRLPSQDDEMPEPAVPSCGQVIVMPRPDAEGARE